MERSVVLNVTPEEYIKLIDEEIAECEELWDIYDEKGDRAKCKQIMDRKVSFEMFKAKVLKKDWRIC